MPIASGTKLGSYEIGASIGVGGMGEVYRARDTKLDREVAIKVLPEEFARDGERLARFEREAKLLASLNHPNVATLYGLEEHDGRKFLVMELVEGETLADRIARGPIPIDEAMSLFIEIAEGLMAAHEKGIIHRDLKPANIKITPEGRAKILDFGLARLAEADTDPSGEGGSQSPTLTKGTALGAIMGTASYMSPEQARGKTVDKRTDVWAYGCCLYEALTAHKAFEGETITDILAAVVHQEPSLERVPSQVPADVQRVLRRCFKKDRRQRFHDIADVRLDLEDAQAAPFQTTTHPRARTPLVAMALVTVAALGVTLWSLTRSGPVPLKPVARFSMPLPTDEELYVSIAGPSVAISPDGQHFAWIAQREDRNRLVLRAASELEGKPLEGTQDALDVFFSPDGRWLGFTARNVLWKVSVSGGAPIKITDTQPRGATWLDEGSIVFSSFDDLRRVSADGGETEVLATPDREQRQKSLRFPDALPGGRVVLFTIGSADMESWDDATIAVLTLETGEIRTLIEGGTNARYSPTGHIVYARGRGLFAVPFDASSLEVTGAPVLVLEPVSTHPLNGPAQFAVSPTGSLLYAPGGPWVRAGRVVMVSRTGAVEPLVDAPQPFRRPRITPDGRRLALEMHSANHSIWTYDFARGALTRLISGFNNYGPLWAPDGSALAFTSDTRGQNDVYMSPADGSGEPELLTPDEGPAAYAISWSPDGRFLLYVAFSPKTRGDIMVLPLAENRTPRVFLRTDANESIARFSPDGRWIAHQSDESGRAEIYLRSFHDPGPKWQVSTEGGADPMWNPQGGELFYHDGGKMMAVDIDLNDAPRLGKPRLLFELSFDSSTGFGYDVMPDGEHFIMIDQSQTTVHPTELIVVQNFAEELRRLVPKRPSGRSH